MFEYYGAEVDIKTKVETRNGWSRVIPTDNPIKWKDLIYQVAPYIRYKVPLLNRILPFDVKGDLEVFEPKEIDGKIAKIEIIVTYRE